MATEPQRLIARFREESDVVRAVSALQEKGLDDGRVSVLSNVPLEEVPSRPSRVLWYSLVGGLVGGTSVFLVASLSAKAYPLVTGGMPIVAGPPVGLVTYEGTALGAILATVLGVLLEGRVLAKTAVAPESAAALAGNLHVLEVDVAAAPSEVDELRALLGAAEQVDEV